MKVNYLDRLEVSASALAAYRQRMNAIAENLANAQTTRTAAGGPYRRKEVVFEAAAGAPDASRAATPPSTIAGTVRARVIEDTQTPFAEVYDPSHPDANADGVVRYPNVNPAVEMVNLILAARAYEANVAALRAEKQMQETALSIGRP